MDQILGETFEVSLGGKAYTLAPMKLKILSRAMSYLKRRKVTDFIKIAKETGLPKKIFSEQLSALYEERDTIGLEAFLEKHDEDPDFVYLCLYYGLREFAPDLSMETFENFPEGDLGIALADFIPPEMKTPEAEAQGDPEEEKKKMTA